LPLTSGARGKGLSAIVIQMQNGGAAMKLYAAAGTEVV
jgi:hypothetical protein